LIDRVELQSEVVAPRELVFPLLATAEGLRQWLDDAELEPLVGGDIHVWLRDAQAVGRVVAYDPPQHISFSWEWLDQPGLPVSLVAFDAIDHGERTHVTLRHVGLPTHEQVELHDQMWRHWLARFDAAVRALPRVSEAAAS
jgi:uncharacterized protein YndB with AHSA1/START domain